MIVQSPRPALDSSFPMSIVFMKEFAHDATGTDLLMEAENEKINRATRNKI